MIIRIPHHELVHTGLFGTSGAGKGVGILIPHMLSYPGSVVCLDPQGSIYEATAEHRRRAFKHDIIRLDSSEIIGPGGDSLNALYHIQKNAKDCLDQCDALANLLIVRTGQEKDPHWPNSAQNIIKVCTYYIVQCEPDPALCNLLAVRKIVASRDRYMAVLNVMRQAGGLLKDQADSLQWLQDEELNSVISYVNQNTSWIDSPAVADSLRGIGFDPLDLRKGRTTVYVIESPSKLETHAGQLRVFFGTMLSVLSRGKASEKSKIWFVIDEAAALGRMKSLESAITTMRGYGIRLLLVYQSPSQLQTLYGDNAKTVLDNLGTQIYIAMRSHESNEHISKLAGKTTIAIETGSSQDGTSTPTGFAPQPSPGSRSHSTTVNTSETGRNLFEPDEVRTVPDSLAWVIHKNMHIITAKTVRYYDSPIFRSWLPGRYRTGESRGLGLAGFVAALACLLLSLAFSSLVGRILEADRHQQAASDRFDGGRWQYRQPVRFTPR